MKFQIDLNNYPHLKQLFEVDKEEFAETLKATIKHIDTAIKENRNKVSQQIYKENYVKLMEKIMNAFFKPEGIINKHHDYAEREGLQGLGANIHPLAIFTNNSPVYNAQGHNISPAEWILQDDFNIEDWLYALFYGARFVSWQELAKYLTLGEYELIDVLKARNLKQLAHIQPALQYQKENGIPEGKLIAGTALLDGGDKTTKKLEKCPACGGEWIASHEMYVYCRECTLGGRK